MNAEDYMQDFAPAAVDAGPGAPVLRDRRHGLFADGIGKSYKKREVVHNVSIDRG